METFQAEEFSEVGSMISRFSQLPAGEDSIAPKRVQEIVVRT